MSLEFKIREYKSEIRDQSLMYVVLSVIAFQEQKYTFETIYFQQSSYYRERMTPFQIGIILTMVLTGTLNTISAT